MGIEPLCVGGRAFMIFEAEEDPSDTEVGGSTGLTRRGVEEVSR